MCLNYSMIIESYYTKRTIFYKKGATFQVTPFRDLLS